MDELRHALHAAVGDPPPTRINLDKLIEGTHRSRRMLRVGTWTGAAAGAAAAVLVPTVLLPGSGLGAAGGGGAGGGGGAPPSTACRVLPSRSVVPVPSSSLGAGPSWPAIDLSPAHSRLQLVSPGPGSSAYSSPKPGSSIHLASPQPTGCIAVPISTVCLMLSVPSGIPSPSLAPVARVMYCERFWEANRQLLDTTFGPSGVELLVPESLKLTASPAAAVGYILQVVPAHTVAVDMVKDPGDPATRCTARAAGAQCVRQAEGDVLATVQVGPGWQVVDARPVAASSSK